MDLSKAELCSNPEVHNFDQAEVVDQKDLVWERLRPSRFVITACGFSRRFQSMQDWIVTSCVVEIEVLICAVLRVAFPTLQGPNLVPFRSFRYAQAFQSQVSCPTLAPVLTPGRGPLTL